MQEHAERERKESQRLIYTHSVRYICPAAGEHEYLISRSHGNSVVHLGM